MAAAAPREAAMATDIVGGVERGECMGREECGDGGWGWYTPGYWPVCMCV